MTTSTTEHDGYTDSITVLDNGVTVATRELDPYRFQPNRCLYAATVRAGARHDPTQRGIAHFVEHLLYGEKIAKEWLNYLRTHGYQGDHPNAATSGEFTAFSIRGQDGTIIHKEDFTEAFSLQLRNIVELDFSTATVENERARIMHEIRGYNDHYSFRRGLEFQSFIHPGYMPGTIGGTEGDVASITRDELMAFYKHYYVGANLLVPVCFPGGKSSDSLNHQKVIDLVDFHLGHLPKGDAAPRLPDAAFAHVERRFPAEQKQTDHDVDVSLSFPGRRYLEKSAYTKKAFLGLFWDKFNEAVHKAGLSYHMNGHNQDQESTRVFGIGFTAPKEKANDMLQIITEQFQELAIGDMRELLVARKFSQKKSLSMDEGSRSNDFSFYNLHTGMLHSDKPATNDHAFTNGQATTFEEVQEFAREVIHAPIAMYMEGDIDGKHVMHLDQFVCGLRYGIPLPAQPLSQILAGRAAVPGQRLAF